MRNKMAGLVWVLFLVAGGMVYPGSARADEPCEPIEKKWVKVEGWFSKKFRKDKKKIAQEFAAMGHTRVRLKPFPMGETAKVVAIGRCVPAHIARHVLQKTLLYTGGVENLVNQAFVAPHWIGVGTTMFDEPSQQKVSPEQVQQLLDPALGDGEFHALYKNFSIQDETVKYFGRPVPNIKRVDPVP